MKELRPNKGFSVVVTRISIQGVPKQNERVFREACPKSQKKGIPFYMIGSQ